MTAYFVKTGQIWPTVVFGGRPPGDEMAHPVCDSQIDKMN
jgi:hypothetical protein